MPKEPEITEELIENHNLTKEEYQKILEIQGRAPSFTEQIGRASCRERV